MTVFRTNNPQEYTAVDGIVIDERAPAPSIRGLSTGVAICVGVFEKGPTEELTEPGSYDRLVEMFGRDSTGYTALVNKRFSRLKIIRVAGTVGVRASYNVLDSSSATVFTFTAKSEGVGGNSLRLTIAAGSNSGNLYTVTDGTTVETHDDTAPGGVVAAFANSNLVDVTAVDTSKTPANVTAVAFTGGVDEAVDDTDYEDAIKVAEAEGSGNVLFLDDYNDARNGYLRAHAATTRDKMVICAGGEEDSVTEAITAVDDLRDTDGRIIYAYNWLRTSIDGSAVFVSPASFVASIISNTSAHIDPAFVQNSQFLYGVSAVRNGLSRADFIQLADAGIMAFQNDPDVGITVKSGIVTQVADSSKITVLRRRMADWITNSIGAFLKNYQGAPNTVTNRNAAKSAILEWIQTQEQLGILPTDNEVQDGAAKIVDVVTPNTDAVIAEGRFMISYRQRIFSSMRFIVLVAEIGQSVVVEEQPS